MRTDFLASVSNPWSWAVGSYYKQTQIHFRYIYWRDSFIVYYRERDT